MTWRDKARPDSVGGGHELPLEDVLVHYGIRHTHRRKQMISCPLQVDDSRPSMSIDLDKQLFKCHACGKGGDVWVLIMEMEGIGDFRGARRFAETAFGIAGDDPGRGADDVRGGFGRERRGRSIPSSKGSGSGRGKYAPSWRRT